MCILYGGGHVGPLPSVSLSQMGDHCGGRLGSTFATTSRQDCHAETVQTCPPPPPPTLPHHQLIPCWVGGGPPGLSAAGPPPPPSSPPSGWLWWPLPAWSAILTRPDGSIPRLRGRDRDRAKETERAAKHTTKARADKNGQKVD